MRRRRWFHFLWIGAGVELLLTFSRGAMLLLAASVVVENLVRRRFREALLVVGCLGAAIAGLSIYAPRTLEEISYRVIYKKQDSLLITREMNYEETIRAASDVGILGGGYGISVGIGGDVDVGTGTSVGYGREKGNGYISLYEETGLPGTVAFAFIVVCILMHWFRWSYASRVDGTVSLSASMFGLVCGLLLHNNIEAWLTSPGSPESVSFWFAAGTLLLPSPQANALHPVRSR